MDYSIDLQGYMPESEYENLKKNLKTFVEEAEDLSREYSLRKESGLVKIGYDSCNHKERNLILSTVAYSLTESESVLQYRITGDAVQFGVISRSGVEELDIDEILEARVREKKQEIQNENLKQGAEEVNRETRNLTLMIDNDEGLKESALELAGFSTPVNEYAERLKSNFSEMFERSGEHSIVDSFAQMALDRVDFDHIANRLKSEIMEMGEQANIKRCQDDPWKLRELNDYEITEKVCEAALEENPDMAMYLSPWLMTANLTDLAAYSKSQDVIEKLPIYFNDEQGNILPYTQMVEIERDLQKEAKSILAQNTETLTKWAKMNSHGFYEGTNNDLWYDAVNRKLEILDHPPATKHAVALDHPTRKKDLVVGPHDIEREIKNHVTKHMTYIVGKERVRERDRQMQKEHAKSKGSQKLTYEGWKNASQEEFNKLPLHFAFGDAQFKQKMAKIGLTEKDTDQIIAFGDSGGFFHKRDERVIDAYLAKNDEKSLHELMESNHDFAVDAFHYEMGNHEYPINSQGDWDVCSCFADNELKYKDGKTGPEYLKEAGYSDSVCKAYREAQRLVRIEEKVRENNEVIHDYCKDVKNHVNSGNKGTYFLCDEQGSFYRDFSPTPMTAQDFEAKCREQDLDIRVVHASSECKDLTHLEQDVSNRVREMVEAKKEERAKIVQEEKKEEKQSFHR
ncbi:MAG: hypothetical protein IKO41_15815 [Lachnospiraceae bacterium]|nr:hypothetical protein [Lachnospiraceae bacterium]